MKTAIIYCTKHGTTEKAARLIAEKLSGSDVSLINLDQEDEPDLSVFDRIIIGGSIHIGTIQKDIRNLCIKHLDELLQKDLGLFICCMLKEKQLEQFNVAFPLTLRNHCKAKGMFGGELLLEKMNLLDKLLVRAVTKQKESVSSIDYPAINRFVSEFEAGCERENIRIKSEESKVWNKPAPSH